MIIFCCGMPRSGSTVQYQIISALAESQSWGRGAGFAREKYLESPDNLVVKSEICHPWIYRAIQHGDGVAIGTYRDYREIIVSLVKFYNKRSQVTNSHAVWGLSDVVQADGYRILADYYHWDSLSPLWFRYETMELEWMAQQIAAYIQIPYIPEIAIPYFLDRNLDRIQTQDTWINRETMLTQGHISSTLGQETWRETLEQKDIEQLENMAGVWLLEHGYELLYI